MTTWVMVAGACLGAGLAGLLVAFVPVRPRLASVERLMAEPPRTMSGGGDRRGALAGMTRSPAVRISRRLESGGPWISVPWTRINSDLRATSLSADRLVSRVLVGLGASVLVPLSLWSLMAGDGIELQPLMVIVVVAACVVASIAVPVVAVRREAERRRRNIRAVLGSFIDLVVLCLAGGVGVEGSLCAAADVGDDWVSRRISREFAICADTGRPLWDGLEQLGDEFTVDELRDLAATLQLAGTEGARVRASLAARSASLRRHEQAEEESAANSMTERLFLPGALLLVGFLLFVGYPAFSRILAGF